jgi:hypothetical protein
MAPETGADPSRGEVTMTDDGSGVILVTWSLL